MSPGMTQTRFLSFNGEIVPWAEAKIHVLSPAVKYGTGVFEGIRGYWNAEHGEMYVFRLKEHLDRLQYSMKVMRYDQPIRSDAVEEAIHAVVRANELREDVHIRPMVWVDGDGEMGAAGPLGWMVSALPRPANPAVRDGVHVAVSSWRRIADTSMPARVKATANYVNGRLVTMQAKQDGYDNALILTEAGHVAESPGSCFFMIRAGKPITPGVTNSILESVTRATVMELLQELTGHATDERDVDRTEVYAADEAFFCGSGQEVQPILSLDRLPVGDGTPGPLTRRLQERYFALVRGQTNERKEWLTPVWKR